MIYILILAVAFTTPLLAGVWPGGGTLPRPLRQGSVVDISWDNTLHAERVDIELWDGERRQFTTIASGLPTSATRVAWTIPATVIPGRMYRFVVRDAAKRSRADFSTGFHEIHKATGFVTTVEDPLSMIDSLLVTPFPSHDRARVAWTSADASTIDVVDLQGVVVMHIKPEVSTRACVVSTGSLQSGPYTVVLTLASGKVHRSPLVVAH